MRRNSLRVFAAVCATTAVLVFASPAAAQTGQQVTFSSPVQLPGIVLAAGVYNFRTTTGDPRVVVLGEDGRVLATVATTHTTRSAAGDVVVFRTGDSGQPPEVASWYANGGMEGLAFVYSRAKK